MNDEHIDVELRLEKELFEALSRIADLTEVSLQDVIKVILAIEVQK
jgi:hypothetical protein